MSQGEATNLTTTINTTEGVVESSSATTNIASLGATKGRRKTTRKKLSQQQVEVEDRSKDQLQYQPHSETTISVDRNRYSTSLDPRGYIPVYEYDINEQPIMWDRETGYVHFTGIWKALGKNKADIAKLVETHPDLAATIKKVRGGFLKIQGTWMPYDSAKELSRRTCFPLKDQLVPIFGPRFPSEVLSPTQPGFGVLALTDDAAQKKRIRRKPKEAASVPNNVTLMHINTATPISTKTITTTGTVTGCAVKPKLKILLGKREREKTKEEANTISSNTTRSYMHSSSTDNIFDSDKYPFQSYRNPSEAQGGSSSTQRSKISNIHALLNEEQVDPKYDREHPTLNDWDFFLRTDAHSTKRRYEEDQDDYYQDADSFDHEGGVPRKLRKFSMETEQLTYEDGSSTFCQDFAYQCGTFFPNTTNITTTTNNDTGINDAYQDQTHVSPINNSDDIIAISSDESSSEISSNNGVIFEHYNSPIPMNPVHPSNASPPKPIFERDLLEEVEAASILQGLANNRGNRSVASWPRTFIFNNQEFQFSGCAERATATLSEPQIPPLLTKLKSDVKDAMRSKDKGKLNVIKGLLSDITYASKSADSTSTFPSTDAEICAIIQRAIKRRQESIDQYSNANRADLASAEQTELEILQTYLPPQLSDQEIEDEVKKVISSVGASSVKDLGRVMKEVKLDSSRAPKKRISEVVKRLLS
ncbi:13008_t:CDS:2 [Ambispora leptoticha]|uniref:Altered inheritance of mitochondria protein 41 n=1 Tax=Ambispora leptoticha TaxID=144679 RepID=A0A9N8VXF5_9GLOM|nr:13008_t:CDS:2 [Ambispora leptoticha]